MGWSSFETEYGEIQEAIRQAPEAALRRIGEALETSTVPTERARLYGLKCAAHKALGNYGPAAEALELGREIPYASRYARAELAAHEAWLNLYRRKWTEAEAAAEESLSILPQPPQQQPRTDWGRRVERRRQDLESAALLARAQARQHLEKHDALIDAIGALKRANSLRAQLAPLSLLAQLLVERGTPRQLGAIGARMEHLARKIPRSDRATHAQIQWTQAIIAARFGATAKAERLLMQTLDDFRSLGLKSQYEAALDTLLWVVKELDLKPARARYLGRKLLAEYKAR